jgi:hypothetical protein
MPDLLKGINKAPFTIVCMDTGMKMAINGEGISRTVLLGILVGMGSRHV